MSQCTARNRSGSQCGLPAFPGATVCRMHGGSAPQVRQKACERILAAAEPALAEMIRLATKAKNESVRRQAAAYSLDRAGLQGHDEARAGRWRASLDQGRLRQARRGAGDVRSAGLARSR